MLEPVDEFFDAGDFAEPATYTPSGGSPSSILVIFDAAGTLKNAGPDQYQVLEDIAYCKTADIPGAGHGGTLLIDSTTYKIMDVLPDGTGITRVRLSRD